MLTAGVLLGLSASVLWIAQASYLTELSVIYATFKAEPVISSMGYFNGIFFAIHNASGITGNLISSLVLDLFQCRMLILLPMFLFGGVMRGFTMGEFTSNFIRESLGSASIGYIMTVFGTVNVLGSYGFGKLTDRCVTILFV
ncbi:hypothetical protein DYB37_004797 [Aphanomyces astaci]|uniref:Nodulin-like domain-containing protein n=1 Tax=Aphanomyces astaci TaxID=112090 RepID=A0A3R7BAC1_APHAT|nr:hypothetical protein DYB37_004797 [Aphanomyces astaci]